MDVENLRGAIRAAIRACVGATDTDAVSEAVVQWEDDGFGIRPTPYVDLLEMTENTIGTDETREEYDETNDRLDTFQAGQRTLVVQIKVTSDDACSSASASQQIRNIRLRLRRPSILAILQAANISVARFGPTHRAPFFQDNREMDSRIMEITFNTADTDTRDETDGDYFDHIEEPEAVIYSPDNPPPDSP